MDVLNYKGLTTLQRSLLNSNRMLVPISDTTQLTIPTYDGSGQAVHPSVVNIPQKFGGYQYWMAFTPYPNTNDDYENPSIVASNDGVTWVVPAGVTNPIVAAPPNLELGGHNSDTFLMYDRLANRLNLYYLRSEASSTDAVVWRTLSTNGTTWSTPVACTFATDGTLLPTAPIVLSPSVIRHQYVWELFYVTGEYLYRATSTDGLTWTHPKKMVHNLPKSNYLWHLDVTFDESGYHGLVCGWKSNGTTSDNRLYYGTSKDGLLWVFDDIPCLTNDENKSWMDRQIYKSSIVQMGNKSRIYFSASTNAKTWHIGYMDVIRNQISKKLDDNVELQLVVSGDNLVIAAGATKSFQALGVKRFNAVNVRLAAASNVSVKILHVINGVTNVYSEDLITNATTATFGKVFEAKTRQAMISVTNNSASDITVSNLILSVFA